MNSSSDNQILFEKRKRKVFQILGQLHGFILYVGVLCSSQKLFIHIETFAKFEPVLGSANEESLLKTQHSASIEAQTSDLLISSLIETVHMFWLRNNKINF